MYQQGRNWLPKAGWASSNATCHRYYRYITILQKTAHPPIYAPNQVLKYEYCQIYSRKGCICFLFFFYSISEMLKRWNGLLNMSKPMENQSQLQFAQVPMGIWMGYLQARNSLEMDGKLNIASALSLCRGDTEISSYHPKNQIFSDLFLG